MKIAIDRLGLTLSALVLLSLALLPLVNLQPNRLLPGSGISFLQLLDQHSPRLLLALLLPTLLLASLGGRLWLKLFSTTLSLLLLVHAVGAVAGQLLQDQLPFARIALGSGFWALLLLLGLLITDALAKLQLSPPIRLLLVAAGLAAIGAMLTLGSWDQLSLILEYHNQEHFWQQGKRHLLLALGSMLPAVLVGVPLGVLCHRSARAKAMLIPLLNLLQTVPSLAMFGLLMIPLSLLSLNFPLLSEYGIRGIGATPAVLALFLYSLLPIVSNTAAGLDGLDPAVVQAARGMGMSTRQRLWQIELPLALPAMLSGLRIVVTMNIGLVAVAGLIGGGGFGTYIFQGLGQTATDLVLLGTIPTILLAFLAALLIDTLIALTKREIS